MDDSRPIFLQIAEHIENDILVGTMAEESQAPSINEFAMFFRINPATALKGVNLLVEEGILYKKRGIGMFVTPGARERVIAKRTELFRMQFIVPLLAEAAKLQISPAQLAELLKKEGMK